MNNKKIGEFIATKRKEKGLTQADLANMLNVTNKAISRWETGKGMPDTSLLKPLANELEISLSELLSGETLTNKNSKFVSDTAITNSLMYSKTQVLSMVTLFIFIIGIIFTVSPLFFVTDNYVFSVLGIMLLIVGIYKIIAKKKSLSSKIDKFVTYILSISFILTALVVEILPLGCVMYLKPSPSNVIIETYSYFNLIPFGNANFAPLLTGVMSIAIFILSIIAIITKLKRIKLINFVFTCSIITAMLSIAPLLLGFNFMNSYSYFISISLLISIALQAYSNSELG